MAYATVEDVQQRLTRTMTSDEISVCTALLDDAAEIIDVRASGAKEEIKKIVSCRMVMRAIGDGSSDYGVPLGASQGSMSAMGYVQSWTMGSGGSALELYLSKAEKAMLGMGDNIGAYSPIEDMVCEEYPSF